MPACADVVVPEVEDDEPEVAGELEDVAVVPVAGELDVAGEVPAEVEGELEVGALAAVEDESGAGFVTCGELLALDELPLFVFAPQPTAAMMTAHKRHPASAGKKRQCMNPPGSTSTLIPPTTERLRKHQLWLYWGKHLELHEDLLLRRTGRSCTVWPCEATNRPGGTQSAQRLSLRHGVCRERYANVSC